MNISEIPEAVFLPHGRDEKELGPGPNYAVECRSLMNLVNYYERCKQKTGAEIKFGNKDEIKECELHSDLTFRSSDIFLRRSVLELELRIKEYSVREFISELEHYPMCIDSIIAILYDLTD